MRTREEKYGAAKEAIVLQWASGDFKPGTKRWAGALLSVSKMLLFCVKTIVKEQGHRSQYGWSCTTFQDNNVIEFILQNLQHATHNSEAGEHIPRLLVY